MRYWEKYRWGWLLYCTVRDDGFLKKGFLKMCVGFGEGIKMGGAVGIQNRIDSLSSPSLSQSLFLFSLFLPSFFFPFVSSSI